MRKIKGTYTLGATIEEQHRLDEQQKLYGDAKYITFDSSNTVCEVGCGSGANLWIANQLTKGLYIGIDFQEAQIKACLQKVDQLKLNNVKFYCADAQELPLADASVDVVFARLVLIHLAHPQNALREMYRILKPGGKMIVIEPDVRAFKTNKPSLMKCFKMRTEYVYRPRHGSINVAPNLGKLFRQMGLKKIEVIQHEIVGTHQEEEKLKKLLTNWVIINKSMAKELIEKEMLTQEDFIESEREAATITDSDYVTHLLWIAQGIK